MAKPGSAGSKKFTKKISARLSKPVAADPQEEPQKVDPVAAAQRPAPAPAPEEADDYDEYEEDSGDDEQSPAASGDDAGQEDSQDAKQDAEESSMDEDDSPSVDSGPTPAGVGKRIGAFVVDSVIVSLLLGAVIAVYTVAFVGTAAQPTLGAALKEGAAVVATAEVAGADTVAATAERQPAGTGAAAVTKAVESAERSGSGDLGQSEALAQVMVLFSLFPVILAVLFAYFFVPEWLLAATLGKLIFGLRVADKDNRKCGFAKALIRNLIKNVLGLISMLVAFFTAKKQAVHDLAAGTFVIGKADLILPAASTRSAKRKGKGVKPAKDSMRGGKKKPGMTEDSDSEEDDRTPAPATKQSERTPAKKPALAMKKPGLPASKKPGFPMKKVSKKIVMKKKP